MARPTDSFWVNSWASSGSCQTLGYDKAHCEPSDWGRSESVGLCIGPTM